MVVPATSERWEVRRGYLSEQRAKQVTKSALWLASTQLLVAKGEKKHRAHIDLTRRVHEIRINYGLMREEDYAVLHDPNARPVIDLHEQTSIETNDQSGLIFVNKYRTGGRFGWHIDQEPYSDADDSLIVNTHGTARIGLKHADGAKCLYDLKPGDAVYIDNSGPSHFRPSHTIWNTTIGTRIAIVD